MKYTARYRKKGANPFRPISLMQSDDSIRYITANFKKNTPLREIRKMAKEATPEGYEFIEAKKER